MKSKQLLIVLAALAASACGPFHMGSRERATLIFSNESVDQADVFATIGSSQTVRVATVFALRTDTIQVPTSVTDQAGGQTSFIVRQLGRSIRPSTGPITLRSTDVVRVRLPSDGRTLFVTPY
jgi:hypothetical protein